MQYVNTRDGQTDAGRVRVETGVDRQRRAGKNGTGSVYGSNTEFSLASFDKRHPQKAFPCLFVPGRVAKQPEWGTNARGNLVYMVSVNCRSNFQRIPFPVRTWSA
jgi:hypothetical protein